MLRFLVTYLEEEAPANSIPFLWKAGLPPSRFSSFGGQGSRRAAFLHLEGEAPAKPLFFIWRARLPPSRFSSFGGRGSRQAAFLHLEGEAPAKPLFFIWRARLPPSRFSSFGGRGSRQAVVVWICHKTGIGSAGASPSNRSFKVCTTSTGDKFETTVDNWSPSGVEVKPNHHPLLS